MNIVIFKIKNFILFSIIIVLFIGCGPEEHQPVAKCLNFGVSNVRRNLHLILSVSVARPPLEGVDSQTVKLLRLPSETQVPGTIYYSNDRIILIPDNPLNESTQYRFEINEGISDVSGKQMDPIYQEFTTGDIFQVYYVDVLRNYSYSPAEVYSIGIYFSEGANTSHLIFGEGNITVYDENNMAQFFNVAYYDDVALAVLNFDYPLEMDKLYILRIGPYIYSNLDGEMLDGDRDNQVSDMEAFEMRFKYSDDMGAGIDILDSITFAQPYNESISRCFLWEFD